jgi:26S proteasome regulatory subunit N2
MPHFLSLSLSPTYIVGLNADLKMPKSFKVKCNAKASRFAYPEKLKEKSDEKKEKVATVSLSTTAKAKSKQAKKEAKEGTSDTEMSVAKAVTAAETKPSEEKVDDKEGEKTRKEPEASVHTLSNPSRVTIPQRPLIEFILNQRYVPIRLEVASGIVMLKDTAPETDDDELAEVCAPMIGEDQDEASAPKPFVWDSKAAFVVPETR